MSFLTKIKDALKKTSKTITLAITGKKIDLDSVDALEDALIMADCGVEFSSHLAHELKTQKFNDAGEAEVLNFLTSKIREILEPFEGDIVKKCEEAHENPYVILVIGVNGNGKTTTIAKLANIFKKASKKPLLVAGDTFRAAAVEQLQYWAEKLDVPIMKGAERADPAGLVFSSLEAAKQNKNDVVLIDTAGRMQNRDDLISELEKIKRVVKKIDPSAPHLTILVLDGLTGQAAHSQVEVFLKRIGLDGIIATKLDSTAKGGALIPLTQKYKLPIFAIGVGEGLDDLEPFSAKSYAESIVQI